MCGMGTKHGVITSSKCKMTAIILFQGMHFLCERNDFKLCILQFHWLFHIPDKKGVSDKKFLDYQITDIPLHGMFCS